MAGLNYEDFYDKVGREIGWDFGNIKGTSKDVNWSFYEEVKKICKSSDVLLDIGTGGGENVLGISPSVSFLIGIDLSSDMIETAKANLKNSSVSNARFIRMNAENIQFPNGFFDVVSNRHSPFSSKEIARIVNEKGTFITQQVSENDKLNLKTFFNRGQSFGEEDGTLKKHYVEELNKAGFSEVKTFNYDATEYIQRPEDLIFLLKHTPIIPNFGEENADYTILEKFIRENETEKGIITNSKRFMIVAKM